MEVKIKRIDKTFPLPKYQTKGAVAFDFYTREQITILPKQINYAPSNLIIVIPNEYMLMIAGRSSLHKKGLMMANNVGIVDQDYCGNEDEIKIALYNFSDNKVIIEKGERIAQGIFKRIEKPVWSEVNDTQEINRGGFGSTGNI
jgi:dUTP pyrophosphatase